MLAPKSSLVLGALLTLAGANEQNQGMGNQPPAQAPVLNDPPSSSPPPMLNDPPLSSPPPMSSPPPVLYDPSAPPPSPPSPPFSPPLGTWTERGTGGPCSSELGCCDPECYGTRFRSATNAKTLEACKEECA